MTTVDAVGTLFPPDHEAAKTRLLPASAIGPIRAFDLDALAPYQRLRILTYSATPTILRTLFTRFPKQRIECVVGSANVIGSLADTFAHQAAVTQAARSATRELDDGKRDGLRRRIERGQLQLRVVRGGVSHTKLYLASESADEPDLAIVGSANLSATALLGRQHELLVGFHDNQAWNDLEAEYERIRGEASDQIDLAALLDGGRRRAETDPGDIPLLDIDHPATEVLFAPPDETRAAHDAGQAVDRIRAIVLKAFRREPEALRERPVGQLDAAQRARYRDSLRYAKPGEEPDHPTFRLRLEDGRATLTDRPWPLDAEPRGVADDVEQLTYFWRSYGDTFRGDIATLQTNYFTFLCWLFIAPLICTLRHNAWLRGHDLIQYPRVGILYGKANAGKTQLVETALRFMFGDEAPQPFAKPFTDRLLRSVEAAYARMPAFFDDVAPQRLRTHATDYIKSEHTSTQATPCMILSMNARADTFPDEIVKRCMLVHSPASLPPDDEGRRIRTYNALSAIRPTTHLYRHYLTKAVEAVRTADDPDWLEVSSRILSGTLAEHGHQPAWAKPRTWLEYHATRYNILRDRLTALLDPERQQRSRPQPGTSSWYQDHERIWVAVTLDTFSRPSFDYHTLPAYLLRERESTPGEFVLDRVATDTFLQRRKSTLGKVLRGAFSVLGGRAA